MGLSSVGYRHCMKSLNQCLVVSWIGLSNVIQKWLPGFRTFCGIILTVDNIVFPNFVKFLVNKYWHSSSERCFKTWVLEYHAVV